MHRKLARLLAVLCALAFVAAACGDSDSDSGSTDTTAASTETTASSTETTASSTETTAASTETTEGAAAAPSGDPIVLGGVLPFSGPQASTGELAKEGVELAVEQINAAGGVLGRPLEVQYKDTMANPEEAVAKVREFSEEGVDFVFGFTTSSGCLAVMPIAQELNMIMISNFCQTNKATGEEFNDNFFRVTTNAESLTRATAKALEQEEPDAVKWVSISPDYEYGHNTVTVFKNEMSAEEPDFQMVDEAWPPFQSPTYNDYITQVADDDAQGVYSTLYAGDMLNMLKQQKPFGLLDGKVFATQGMDVDVIEPMAASGDLPELWNGIVYYADAFDNPTNDAFVAAFEEKYDVTPTFYPVSGYLSILALQAAFEKAGSTEVDAVKDALAGIEYDTPMGTTTIRAEDHQAIFENIAVVKVSPTADGGYEVTNTVLVPGADVTSPPNPGQQNPFDVEN
jgi:branched-chain amino acid transport system substrate-binding protein